MSVYQAAERTTEHSSGYVKPGPGTLVLGSGPNFLLAEAMTADVSRISIISWSIRL